MSTIAELDRIAITVKSHRLLQRLLSETPTSKRSCAKP